MVSCPMLIFVRTVTKCNKARADITFDSDINLLITIKILLMAEKGTKLALTWPRIKGISRAGY